MPPYRACTSAALPRLKPASAPALQFDKLLLSGSPRALLCRNGLDDDPARACAVQRRACAPQCPGNQLVDHRLVQLARVFEDNMADDFTTAFEQPVRVE